MRILMICLRYPPTVGGVERAAATLSNAIARRSHEVTVITGTSDREAAGTTLVEPSGVVVQRIELPTGRGAGPRFMREVLRAAGTLPRPDVIHAHTASVPALVAVVLARRRHCPVVVKPSSGSAAGGNLTQVAQSWGGRWRVRLLRRRVDAWVAVSADIANDLVRHWRVASSRVWQIPNGVELSPDLAHARGRLVAGPSRFLFVGRLDDPKGVDVLIDAWTRAQEPGTLTIVGDGPGRETLERVAPSSVLFVGAVADPQPYFSSADVFVLPSRREGLSNALLEAVAAGLPVIATDVGDASAVLGSAGCLVAPGDAVGLAEALAAPPPPPAPREQIAPFGIDAVAKRHEELYEAITVDSLTS